MKTIWKYELAPEIDLKMPKDSVILTVQLQNGKPQLWALVDPNLPKETRKIRIYGTGHTMSDKPGLYWGTFQMATLVFHVFEER